MPRRLTRRPFPAALTFSLSLLATSACHRRHIAVASVPELGYPRCGTEDLPPGEVLAAGRLRPGPGSLEKTVLERFEVRRRDCLVVADDRQEWPLQAADVQIVYDARTLLPLRAWRRLTIPGVADPSGHADIRRYEFRTPTVTVKRRSSNGTVSYEEIRGGIPRAVIAPGRGLLTLWIQRARLPVGGSVRELVLDLRQELEELRPVTLRRDPDMFAPTLGRNVRVYTIYGRESVFADEHDVVIGDLAGTRPSETAAIPEPASQPLYGAPDPVHTP